MTKETIRAGIDRTGEIEEFHLVVGYSAYKITEIDQGMNRIIEMTRRGSFRGNLRMNQNFRGQNFRGGYRENYRND